MISQNTNVYFAIRIAKECLTKKLKKRFFNNCQFSNHDNNNFTLLLRKGVFPKEYIDDLEISLKRYMKIKIFTVTLMWKILLMQITLLQEDFVKILK